MRPWLLVSGDFVTTGGQDRANHALARYLLARGDEVHLVAHRAAEDLLEAGAELHRVPKPGRSYLLGEPLLDHVGRHWARALRPRAVRVVVNGGGCQVGDVNWVHYVHAAWSSPAPEGSPLRRLKLALQRRRARILERRALNGARVVVANSLRTARDLSVRLSLPAARVHTVYLGVDAERFRPASSSERRAARECLGWDPEGRTAVFVGGLSDHRKGFDTVFATWKRLGRRWPVDLVCLGAGRGVSRWQRAVEEAGLGERIRFLGLRRDVENVLRASDLLVAPTRYEPYGLGVHEALCCGLPALVTRSAGVAERYPRSLEALRLPSPDDALDLARRVSRTVEELAEWRAAVAPLAESLRARTWEVMAEELVAVAERA